MFCSFPYVPTTYCSPGLLREGEHSGKIRGYDVAIETPSWRRVGIGLVDIKAGVPSQLVAKLSQPFVAHAKIQRQRPSDPVVILYKCREPFPHSLKSRFSNPKISEDE